MDLDINIIESAVKLAAILGALISLILAYKTLHEYRNTQKWKRLEFIHKDIKEFFNDFNMKRAFLLLDYNKARLPLLKEELGKEEDFLIFDESIFLSSLRYHEDLQENEFFTNKEFIIRNILDDFLLRLGMYHKFVENNLLTVKDIEPYIGYYIEIIANPKNTRQSKEIRHAIWNYIDKYKFKEVQVLCLKFGHNVKFIKNN